MREDDQQGSENVHAAVEAKQVAAMTAPPQLLLEEECPAIGGMMDHYNHHAEQQQQQQQQHVLQTEVGEFTIPFNLDAKANDSSNEDEHQHHHDGNSSSKSPTQQQHRTGRWTLDEKILFLYGLRKFGKGRWKKMSIYLPNRSLVQIKSHAQKVLKRMDAGENVFRRFEENEVRLEALVAEIHKSLGLDPPALLQDIPAPLPKSPKRKRRTASPTVGPTVAPGMMITTSTPSALTVTSILRPATVENESAGALIPGKEHIIAASALCQLAAPSRDVSWYGNDASNNNKNNNEVASSSNRVKCSYAYPSQANDSSAAVQEYLSRPASTQHALREPPMKMRKIVPL